MKKLFVPVVCALVGCAAGVAMPALTAQSYGAPSPSTPRWENYCAFDEAPALLRREDNQHEFNGLLQRMGQQGWEYVGPVGAGWITPCFRRTAQ